LEEYLSVADTMPPEFVEASEKAREKERRQKAREEKMEAQRIEQVGSTYSESSGSLTACQNSDVRRICCLEYRFHKGFPLPLPIDPFRVSVSASV
jgi:hypothetical protein